MAKIQKIEDHAKKIRTENYRTTTWECKHCKKRYDVWYDDFKSLRAHLRRNHPIEYKPYTIEEEDEHVLDHLSLLRA